MIKKKRTKKSKNFLLDNYKSSLNYIKECKNFIYLIILIFFLSSVLGFFVPLPEQFQEEILKMLNEIFEKTEGFNQWQMIKFLFLNNFKSSFFGVIFGVIFGFFPLISDVVNGYLLGFVAKLVVAEQGFSILWRLFPHGIFELPAVFISLGMGLKLSTFIFEKNKVKSLLKFFWNSLKVFILVVIPLLIIAAIIEGTFIVFFG